MGLPSAVLEGTLPAAEAGGRAPHGHSPPSHSGDGVNIISRVLNRACENHLGGYKANTIRKGVAGKAHGEVRIGTQPKEMKHFKSYSRS